MSAPVNSIGVYLRTSRDFQLDDEELRLELTKMAYEIAFNLNLKDTGIYQTVETLTSQTFFNNANVQQPRYTFRKVFSIGAIAAGATLNTIHNITGFTSFTRIYGTCITDAVDYRPLPYASTTANANIELRVTATQITIINGAASPNITSGIVVLEYLKN